MTSCYETEKGERAINDGINEKGLVANLLWFTEAKYPELTDVPSGDNLLCVSAWAQYILDLCDSVETAYRDNENNLCAASYVCQRLSRLKPTCHLAVGDSSGKVAVFEYLEGQLHISSNAVPDGEISNYHYYELSDMSVMTNEPKFADQQLINNYWKLINKRREDSHFPIALPGNSSSIDRFVRASYYTRHLAIDVDKETALAGVASVMHNVSRPIGTSEDSSTSKPNESKNMVHQYVRSRCASLLLSIGI